MHRIKGIHSKRRVLHELAPYPCKQQQFLPPWHVKSAQEVIKKQEVQAASQNVCMLGTQLTQCCSCLRLPPVSPELRNVWQPRKRRGFSVSPSTGIALWTIQPDCAASQDIAQKLFLTPHNTQGPADTLLGFSVSLPCIQSCLAGLASHTAFV